jgi:hypothetical protein
MSSDSDEEIGRRLDYSSDEEPKKKQRKKPRETKPKEKRPKAQPPPQAQAPPPPLPPSGRLNKARRDYIIQNFNLGKEDPEYSVQKMANGSYRVSKRKSYFSPTASVESGSKEDVQMTWLNLQNQVNENLMKDVHKLRKRYEKLADKYESKHDSVEPPKPPEPPKYIEPVPQPVVQQASPPQVRRRPTRRNRFTYSNPTSYNVRDY